MSVTLYRGLEESVAYTEPVVGALERAARKIAAKAAADLYNKAAHPYSEGHSYITMTRGDLDRYVVLVDRDTDRADWLIGAGKKSGHKLGILLDAAGL